MLSHCLKCRIKTKRKGYKDKYRKNIVFMKMCNKKDSSKDSSNKIKEVYCLVA